MPNGTPPNQPDLDNLVTPDPDDEGTEQAPTKRHPWSKPKVQTKPTRKDRRAFEAMLRAGDEQ